MASLVFILCEEDKAELIDLHVYLLYYPPPHTVFQQKVEVLAEFDCLKLI